MVVFRTCRLCGGRKDGAVSVWDCHAPNLGLVALSTLGAHTASRQDESEDTEATSAVAAVTAMTWLQDGKKLVTGGSNGVISVWQRDMSTASTSGGRLVDLKYDWVSHLRCLASFVSRGIAL